MPKAAKSKGSTSKKTALNAPKVETTSTSTPGTSSTLYFWRQSDLQKGWLSQWYEADFTDPNGIVYHTAEHYMMYHKALLFNDPATGALILNATSPRDVRTLGRQVANFDQAVWEANRERIVEEGTRYKFTRAVSEEGLRLGMNPDAELIAPMTLRGLLMATGEREIVEASPMDKIWGVGFGEAKAEGNRGRWGLNLLGKVLVKVREEFREEDEKAEAAAGV
ncbi:hypothetical protein B0T16DRAFT_452928 [Cercophora newfieldiana]|uniref:NADAR domain-containing protein n=1 Tax=Cercophora newfieldiana TaxID=92897 RepID=A0AA40CZL2_9PEZI|nr:hypothetical protein B0T16DRAFT_452928 [Cercophora newfieldiana]